MGKNPCEVWKTDSLVKTYLESVRGGIPFAAQQIEIMLRLAGAAGNGKPARFMDIGCGDGVLSASILARFPEAKGVLVDFSEPMLVQARARLAGHASGLEFVTADYGQPAWRAPFEDGSFDLIVSGYSIHHQPDERKRSLYREIFNLLSPGGLFVNIEHVSSPSEWVERNFEELFVDSMYAFARSRGAEKSREQVSKEFYNRPDKDANILAPVELQCEWLRACWFRDVDCCFKVFELAVFGGRKP